jgi:thiamine pyrophosphokinase
MAKRVLILAGGSAPHRSGLTTLWPGWDEAIELVIGADAGALLAAPLGLRLDMIVGDADSLGEARLATFARSGVAIERSPADKDASDTELALLAAAGAGATDIVILGAFGGRFDHQLANVWILAHPALAGRTVALLDEHSRVRLLDASANVAQGSDGTPTRLELHHRPGGLVTLLPFDGPATGVTTHGLRWALTGATLATGSSLGLSNEVLDGASDRPSVKLDGGRLLVIETSLLGSVDEHA